MEQPSLEVIKEIADNDADFENSILTILKKEFAEEASLYHKSFDTKNLEEASDIVHKLKHKISLLALHKGVQLAANYEKELKIGNIELHQEFTKVLEKIDVYLYK